jgi:RNA recognition motif-containing protein
MSFTVFLGNLPAWVTADDIKAWLSADDLVADSIKVIRNHDTQESKGFAFVEAPTAQEMQSIIRRLDRAPLDGKLLRANAAQPSRAKAPVGAAPPVRASEDHAARRPKRSNTSSNGSSASNGNKDQNAAKSAFATQLAKAL